MADLGECKNKRCSKPAVKVAMLGGINRETGEEEVIAQPVCEEHYRLLTTECVIDGCDHLAMNIIEMSGTTAKTGEHASEEFAFCDSCLEQIRSSPTVTIDGITMVHDGDLRFRRVPKDVGRG